MPTMPSNTADRPYWPLVTPKPACNVGQVYGVSLTWTNTGLPPGHQFIAWVVQRSDDSTGYYEIARLPLIGNLDFVDYEGRRNVLASYRVLMETDGGISAPSNVRTATAPGCCGYTFTSNAQRTDPLNMARDDLGDRAVIWPEERSVTEWPLYGRNNVVVFKGTEDPGDEMKIEVLLWQTSSPPVGSPTAAVGPGVQAWEPVRRLVRSQTPYVAVLDESGSRWYASITADPGGELGNDARTWIASLRIRQVSDVPYSVSA